jgi:hypothetical protein
VARLLRWRLRRMSENTNARRRRRCFAKPLSKILLGYQHCKSHQPIAMSGGNAGIQGIR